MNKYIYIYYLILDPSFKIRGEMVGLGKHRVIRCCKHFYVTHVKFVHTTWYYIEVMTAMYCTVSSLTLVSATTCLAGRMFA
jgi:hypothetical protein